MSSLIRLFKSGRTVQRVATYLVLGGLSGLVLTACGGGKTSSGGTNTALTGDESANSAQVYVVAKPASRNEAARFLTQSTFGPVDADIDRLMTIGYTAWINEQMTLPQPAKSHLTFWNERNAAIMAANASKRANSFDVTNSFWRQSLSGQDQLRQRVAFALSQIFVLSMADGCGADQSQGVASYMDMLGQNAFGSYRSLLESVAMHPVMGCYLSHIKNQKEDIITGRVPDENFAREIMQLFSIGLYQLNTDGTLKRDGQGNPIETYGPADIAGLAKVFTGFSWDCPGWPSDRCFKWGTRDGDYAKSPNQFTAPMRPYAQFHSTSEKRFLGQVIPAQSTPKPEESLKTALDTLANHANVAPFIGKQMIQRLVTSNPSPAYVSRVATAFKRSGLNLGSLVTAVLMDPEARTNPASGVSSGKVKEPILKFTAILRAFGATSASGDYIIGYTDNPARSLGQSPLMSSSVFNFYRPGYVAPSSNSSAAGLVTPEMQLANETAVAGYVNFVRDLIAVGVGYKGYSGSAAKADVQLEFNQNPNSQLLNRAIADPAAMVDQLSNTLTNGELASDLKAEIVSAITTIDYRTGAQPTADQIYSTKQRRVWAAILLVAVSPEFQVQR